MGNNPTSCDNTIVIAALITFHIPSSNWTQGAAVQLILVENEREFDRCPMYFNDGADPWSSEDEFHPRPRVFDFSDPHQLNESSRVLMSWTFICLLVITFL